MEQPISKNEYCTTGRLFFSTLIGGPLAGAYLLSENFKKLGEPLYSKRTLFWGIAVLLLLVIINQFIPAEWAAKIPKTLPTVIFTIMAVSLFQQYQKADIKSALDSGAQKYPIYKVILVSLLSLAISVALIFIATYISLFFQ